MTFLNTYVTYTVGHMVMLLPKIWQYWCLRLRSKAMRELELLASAWCLLEHPHTLQHFSIKLKHRGYKTLGCLILRDLTFSSRCGEPASSGTGDLPGRAADEEV